MKEFDVTDVITLRGNLKPCNVYLHSASVDMRRHTFETYTAMAVGKRMERGQTSCNEELPI